MTQSRYELSALTAGGLAVAASLLLVVPAAAQTGTITGSALSAATGERLDAALVSLVGSDLQALTQINGRFVLVNVPAGEHTLQVDLIGFTTTTEAVTVTAGAVSAINVRMEIEAIVLGRLVVTGVQGAMSRLKVPFEVAQVNVGDLPLPPMTAAQAIQGKIAGAQVFSGSGRPGSAPSILLRGATSIDASGRSQEPLYIVDGVILGSSLGSDPIDEVDGVFPGSSLVDLDALDIQSIEVVKGAAAASLYGSRAANGVVHICTKRGAEIADNSVQYTFRTEYGGSQLDHTPELLLARRHEFALTADGSQFVDVDGSPCDWLDCASPQLAGQNAGGGTATEWNTVQDQAWPGQTYDQVQRFFTSSNVLQSNVSAAGRSGRTNFHVSASYLDQEGIIRDTPGFERTNFRVNVDQEVSDNFLIQTSVFYSRSSQGRFREQSGSPIFDLTRVPAGVDLLAEDPNFPGELAVAVNPTDALTGNPIYVLRNFKRTQWRGRLLGSSSIRYTPSRFLTLDANVSFDRLDNDIERIRPKGFRTVTPDAELNDGTFFKWRGGAGARR